MWLDGVLALPLVLLGVESLVRQGRFRLLILSLAYSFITCFYIGYMIGIFSGIYLIYCFFAVRTERPLDGGAVLARLGLFMIAGATAVLISAFMLLPVYDSLSLGKFDFSTKDYTLRTYGDTYDFGIFDMGRKLLPNTYDTVRNDGMPFLYGGMLTVIMLPLFFIGSKLGTISFKKRVSAAILTLVMTLCMYITPVDMLWHGGQLTNWLPYRYSFILTFLFIAWGAEAFEKLGDFSRRSIGLSAVGVLGLILYYESKDTFVTTLRTAGVDGRELFDFITVVLPAILLVVVFGLLLINRNHKMFKRHSLCFIIGVVVVLELGFNTFASLEKQDNDITYSLRTSYAPHIAPMREKVEEIKANDDGFYRIEKNFHRTVNDPIALGMYGFSHSSSMLNSKPIKLTGQLGLTARSHYTRYSGATPLFNDLFGVKYVLSCQDNNYTNIRVPEDITVQVNENVMTVAYLTDLSLNFLNFDNFPGDENNIFMRQNRLLSAMLGETQVTQYIKTINRDTISKQTENLYEGTALGGYITYNKISPGHHAQVKYTMTAEADGEVFMWLPTGYERRVSVRVDRLGDEFNEWGERQVLRHDWRGEHLEYDDYCIKNLGVFSEGENFSVVLIFRDWDDLFYRDYFFGYVDYDVYTPAINRLHEMNANTIVTKNSPTSITVQTAEATDRLLFTTIPAEPGWSLYIDGRKAEYHEVLGALIAVVVPAGAHTIELKYFPASYPLALILSGSGIIIFILLSLLYSKMRKERLALQTIYGGYGHDSFDEDEEQPTADSEDEPTGEEADEPQDPEDDLILGNDESIDSIINDFREINAPGLPDLEIPVPPILPLDETFDETLDELLTEPLIEPEHETNSFDEFLLEPVSEEQEEEILQEDEDVFFAQEQEAHDEPAAAEEEFFAQESDFFTEEAEILTDEAKVFAATTSLEPEDDDSQPVQEELIHQPEYASESELEYIPEPTPEPVEEDMYFEKKEDKTDLPSIDFEARKKALEMELMAQTIRKAELEVGLLSQQLSESEPEPEPIYEEPAPVYEEPAPVREEPAQDNSYGTPPPPPEPVQEADYTPLPDYGYFEFAEEEQEESVEHFDFDDVPPNSL